MARNTNAPGQDRPRGAHDIEACSIVAGVRTAEDLARRFLEWAKDDPRDWPVSFRAWADSTGLDTRVGREVRIAVIRARNFGGAS